MNHTARSLLTATRKRKDREDSSTSPMFYNQQQRGKFGISQKQNTTSLLSRPSPPPVEPGSPSPGLSNQLLAGYMAHEFLTKGTLFGQKFDPARAEAVPVSAASDSRRKPPVQTVSEPKPPSQSYAEVAQLLKTEGAHIPGVVNPTQLARWIQM